MRPQKAASPQAGVRAQRRLASELCTKALELSRDGHDPQLAVIELLSLSGGDLVALELASGRCRALLGLVPEDPCPGRALGLLTRAARPSA